MTKRAGEAILSICYFVALGAACYGSYVTVSAQYLGDEAAYARGLATVVGAIAAVVVLWHASDSLAKILNFSTVHAALLKKSHTFVCPACGHTIRRVVYRQVRPRCQKCGARMTA